MKCKKHSKYQAKRKPMHTMKYPNGCPQCWKVWHDVRRAFQAEMAEDHPILAPWEDQMLYV